MGFRYSIGLSYVARAQFGKTFFSIHTPNSVVIASTFSENSCDSALIYPEHRRFHNVRVPPVHLLWRARNSLKRVASEPFRETVRDNIEINEKILNSIFVHTKPSVGNICIYSHVLDHIRLISISVEKHSHNLFFAYSNKPSSWSVRFDWILTL